MSDGGAPKGGREPALAASHTATEAPPQDRDNGTTTPDRPSPFPLAGMPDSWLQGFDSLVEPYVVKYLWDPRFPENCAFRGVQTFVMGYPLFPFHFL